MASHLHHCGIRADSERINCGFESKNYPNSQGARPFANAKTLKARCARWKKSKNPLHRGARATFPGISRAESGDSGPARCAVTARESCKALAVINFSRFNRRGREVEEGWLSGTGLWCCSGQGYRRFCCATSAKKYTIPDPLQVLRGHLPILLGNAPSTTYSGSTQVLCSSSSPGLPAVLSSRLHGINGTAKSEAHAARWFKSGHMAPDPICRARAADWK